MKEGRSESVAAERALTGELPMAGHSWVLPPAQAVALQRALAARVVAEDLHPPFETVGGVDIAVRGNLGRSAVVVLELATGRVIEVATAEGPVAFPYVPGLLSFREGPLVLEALRRLSRLPDVMLFDGQGQAHPRRLGIASHIGVLLDMPAVGCAKSRLCGVAQEPGTTRGAWTPLVDDGATVGAVLRTREGVRPVYVSVGHRVSLQGAIELVLRCGAGRRLPEPTRLAHFSAAFRP